MNVISLGQTEGGLYFPIKISENDHNILTASSVVEPNAQVLLGTPECLAIVADSLPALPLVDPQDRQGWYYINSSNTNPNKMNWYFYSGVNKGYRMADLRLITTIASLTNPLNKFFFVVYTKNGSSRTYQTPELLLDGEKCLFFFGESGYIPNNEGNLREVRLLATHDDGLVEPGMEILYISIHSDSAFAKNSYAVCVERFGYRLDNITMDIILATPSSGGGVSSDVNILSSVPISTNILSSVNLDVINQSLTDMSFYDDGVKGKYLNVEVPRGVVVNNTSLTVSNTALSSMSFTDGKLQVAVPSGISVKTSPTSFNSWTEADFAFYSVGVPLPTGSFSPVVDLSNNPGGFIFWGYGVKTSGGGSHSTLLLQLSNDNSVWLDTIYSVPVIDASKPFTLVCDFACKYVRLIVRDDTIDSIYLNMNYK
jgi:hypothetical protein